MHSKHIQQQSFKHLTNQDFASMLSKYKYQLNIGDITGGTVFSQEKKGFLVDIGENVVAYLPKNEVSINKGKLTAPVVNNSREFFIIACNKKTKQLILSIKRLEYIRGWQRIKQIKREDAEISVQISGVNKGGLIATLEGVQCFIPNSHIVANEEKKLIINSRINCQILFINEKTNTVILSQKRATLKNLLSIIHVGQNTKGRVTKIEDYGIFINIHGFTALLHVSEIDKIHNIKSFRRGDLIYVQIIHIDTKQGRLSVSTKRLI